MTLPLALRMAARELRGGLAGFRIFLGCLALGVAAIAAVGSLTAAFERGLAAESRTLLGGDIEVELTLREASDDELAWMRSTGQVSHTVDMRANAVRTDRRLRRLVQLKAVDTLYPFLGTVELAPAMDLRDALAIRDGVPGAVAEGALLRRLEIGIGERVILGTQEFEIRAEVLSEPDSVSAGFRLGPRLMIGMDGLEMTGLNQLGSLVDHEYRVLLPDPASEAAVRQWVDNARAQFPDSDWQIRERSRAAPSARQIVAQTSVFLTLVGLTALIVGGVGVGNAVKSYLDRKTRVIATYKCLGASGNLVFRIYFAQVLALGLVGILIGLAIGAAVPFLIQTFFADLLPVPARFAFYPLPLILAALYGVLVAVAFSVWPLARAREVPAAGLFRDLVAPARRWPRPGYITLTAIALAAICALAVVFTQNRVFSAVFLAATATSFVLLLGAAALIARIAKALGRPRRPALRLALTNLYRPGAATGSVVLSLGLGLTLLVTVSLIDGNISAQVRDRLPEGAPAFFFVDIPNTRIGEFETIVESIEGTGSIDKVASLRGRIVRIDGIPADEAEVAEGGRWAIRGDRGVTYAAQQPPNAELTQGDWWPADYDGPPLLSMDAELAGEFNLEVGDTLTMNVLGREITATIANLRVLDWETIGLNFIFVYSPGLLSSAPHTFVATVIADPEAEDALERAVGDAFPNVSAIRVREALESIGALVADLALAVRGASLVTLIAGIMVLAGAMAAGHQRRVYDASVLKVLGATRGRVMSVYLLEYAMLGFATAIMAAGAGTLAAYWITTQVMQAPWTFLPGTLIVTVTLATVVTAVLGLIGTLRSLGIPAARVLRTE